MWIVSELFPPEETATAYILGEIANAMARKYRVGVICGPEVYDRHKRPDVENPFRLDPSVQIIRIAGVGADKNKIRGKASAFLLVSLRLLKLAKRHIQEGEKVLMVTNPAPLVALLPRLKRKRNFDLTILVHDVFPENTRPAGLKLPGFIYRLIKRVFDRAYSKADLLIVLGRDMRNILADKVRRYNPGQRIEIIENWGDVKGIVPQPFPKGPIILEYAGNIGRVQGLDRVADTLPDDLEFHIYGTGAMERRLKARNNPNLFFHGPYFRSQQTRILGACDIALVTLEEGMYGLGVPSKTYNILASGRPILFLGPKDSEIDLLVREHGIGYCGWPEQWDRKELEAMGRRARELAETKYSKEAILNKFLNMI